MRTPSPLQWLGGIYSILVSLWTQKNPVRVILTSFHGRGYRGNTRVLYEALLDHPYLEPVWLSTDHELVRILRSRFGDRAAYIAHSPAGIQKLASAGTILFTHGTSDYPFLFLPRSSIRIQTYHGLPTKRGEYLRPGSDQSPGYLHRKILEYRFRPISYFLSTSPLVSQIFSSRFGLRDDQLLETGFPAYDPLIRENRGKTKLYNRLNNPPRFEQVILYAPTYRKLKCTRWLPFEDRNPDKLDQFLDHHNSLLILRPHPNDKIRKSGWIDQSDRIIIADHSRFEDVNLLIAASDVILTDYSSIFLEGLLRDIPPVFIPYDLDTYERGTPLPYDEMTPGPHVTTQAELLDAIGQAFIQPDKNAEDRERVREQFFSVVDDQSTERLIQFLEEQSGFQKQSSEKQFAESEDSM